MYKLDTSKKLAKIWIKLQLFFIYFAATNYR